MLDDTVKKVWWIEIGSRDLGGGWGAYVEARIWQDKFKKYSKIKIKISELENCNPEIIQSPSLNLSRSTPGYKYRFMKYIAQKKYFKLSKLLSGNEFEIYSYILFTFRKLVHILKICHFLKFATSKKNLFTCRNVDI